MNTKLKLIYIAGIGRSGSTLLSALVSEADDCLSIGEPINLWNAGLFADKCSCGEPIINCSLWGEVFKNYFQVEHWTNISIFKNTRPLWKMTDIIRIFLKDPNLVSQEYLENLKKLYLALFSVSGKKILIDESKFFPYLYALNLIDAFEMDVIHIVRDPRAVAFSWQRKKTQQNKTMKIIPWHLTAFRWILEQFVFYYFLRTQLKKMRYFLKYEDLVKSPQSKLEELFTNLNLNGSPTFVSANQFEIKNENHFVISNPSMPKYGVNTIKIDNEWQEKMPRWAKMLVTFICWPMMLVYGYPIFSDHA